MSDVRLDLFTRRGMVSMITRSWQVAVHHSQRPMTCHVGLQVSEKTRASLLVVKQTLLNTVPKAIVFHQVKQAEEHLLSAMQASVAGFEEEQLANLLGEDPAVAQQRSQIRARVNMLRKAVHEISSFSG